MAIGGFEKISEFLRDAIKKYNENGVEEKILQLTKMVTDISTKIVKIYNTILSGLTFDERVIVEKGGGILPIRKGDQKQLTPEERRKQSSMLKLAMEVKKIVEEVGDVTKILKPVPEEELKKDRPKTDHLSFLKFKNK